MACSDLSTPSPPSNAVPGARTPPRYAPPAAIYDEAYAGPDRPRAPYAPLLAALEDWDLEALRAAMLASLRERGVSFRTMTGEATLEIDLLPRVLTAAEWEPLATGLAQRVRALDAFCADAYGERRIIAAGQVPARLVDSADHHEPAMTGARLAGPWVGVGGLDLVRDPTGEFLVLEDNLRTPSGLAYAAAARAVLDLHAPWVPPPRRAFDEAFELLHATLLAAAPADVEEPLVVLLSDGPENSAWYEHRVLAGRLGIDLVTLADLELRGGELLAWLDGRPRRVDVVYRRTDEVRVRTPEGAFTAVAEALHAPLTSGRLGVVNGFGTGVADDKLSHAYAEEMIRFYLDEEPILRSVPTYDLGEPDVRASALARLGELVVKPRSGYGGEGVVIGPRADADELAQAARRVARDPEQYIAQETIQLSTVPTCCDGRLVPRHVDLRPFVFMAGGQATVAPGGLTRVAMQAGSLVVNSSQGGGGKDTWVLLADGDR